MKKWIVYTLLVVFAATTASAQWWKLGLGEEETAPTMERPQQMQHGGKPGGQRPQISEEKRAEMKAKHEAVWKLADAARTETNPVKKEALIADIRVEVTKMVDKMQAEQKKRLEKAEQELPKLRERLATAEKNKEQKIEEHVQKLLAGKKMGRPEGKHPGQKGPQPPVE